MIILGSTGSIGKNALSIAKKFHIPIESISCNKNIDILIEQIEEFRPKFVCVGNHTLANKVRLILKDKNIKIGEIFVGEDGILSMIKNSNSTKAINALVGFAGLKPSVFIQKCNKKLLLANKESLVVGGKFLKSSQILPIDSEHFGLKFLLKDEVDISKMIITASGGAFVDSNLSDLKNATASQALKHPNWSMGAKITIDSATMANKLFEILEAFWLYKIKNIDAIIEKSSTIHAFIDFIDGSTTAHISQTDMKLAIAHAMIDDLNCRVIDNFNILKLTKLNFKEISLEKYPIFKLKKDVLKDPNLGVIINAANEVFVEMFLKNICKFTDIEKIVFDSLNKFVGKATDTIEELVSLDYEVKNFAKRVIC